MFVEGLIDPNPPTVTETAIDPKTIINSTQLSKGITLAKGAISLHDLFSGRDKLEGKTVVIMF